MSRCRASRCISLSRRAVTLLACAGGALGACSDYWFEHVTHGWSYRNVTAFGARGDGVTDDTAAIQAAIDFERGGDAGSNADKSAAFVYIPAGTYKVTDTLVVWKWTTIQGNALCPPVLLLPSRTPGFDGSSGLRPLVITNGGFNSTTSEHAWWEESAQHGGETNVYFFSSIRSIGIVVEEGNTGAVALTWNVAQQTTLRNVTINAASDTAVALDVGVTSEYEHWNAGVPFTLGGGGTIEDVTIVGARTGIRIAATQFPLRGISIHNSSEVALRVLPPAWSLAFLQLTISSAPLAIRLDAGLQGVATFIDVAMSDISGNAAISIDAGSRVAPIVLQNVVLTGSTPWIVDGDLLPASSSGRTLVGAWATGPVYGMGGVARTAAYGPLQLPTLADAMAQGIALACSGATGSPHLCGGSADDPSSGIPARARPIFGESTVLSAFDYGAVGDGKTDATAALHAALAALANAGTAATLFIPFGIYLVHGE